MKIILGTIAVSLSVFAYCIVLLGVRDPRKPWWAADMLVDNGYIMIIMGLGVGGLMTIGSAFIPWKTVSVETWHVLISAGLLAITIAGVKLMRIKERLARLESLTTGEAEVIPLATNAPDSNGHRPDTPKIAA